LLSVGGGGGGARVTKSRSQGAAKPFESSPISLFISGDGDQPTLTRVPFRHSTTQNLVSLFCAQRIMEKAFYAH